MEKKDSTVFGIPFALLFFVVALAVFIDGFIWFVVYSPLKTQLTRVENRVTVMKVSPSPTVEPTATPSATITVAPTVRSYSVPSKAVLPTK